MLPMIEVTVALLAVMICLGASGIPAGAEQAVRFPAHDEEEVSLEGLLHIPPGEGRCAGVVIVHPHPKYGGSMSVPVVRAVQQALAEAGHATLRFNLRGVGASGGSFDDGRGEVGDCRGALAYLRAQERVDSARVGLVGYSFGAWVGLQACVQDGKVAACVGLAFPAGEDEAAEGHAYFGKIKFPTLLISGDADDISSLSALRRIIEAHGAGAHCSVQALEGVDHFFFSGDHLPRACRAVTEFLRDRLRPPGPGRPAD